MKNISYRQLAILIMLASAGALAFAYTAQYGFNLQPCILCLYQRKPYFIVIVLSLLAAVFAGQKPKAAFYLLMDSAVVFAIGAGIGLFHTGVEHGWWKGLQSCGDATLPVGIPVEEMKKYMMNRPIVRCDVAAWKMFGISMSGYNFLLSSCLAVFTACLAIKGKKK